MHPLAVVDAPVSRKSSLTTSKKDMVVKMASLDCPASAPDPAIVESIVVPGSVSPNPNSKC